MAGEKLLGSGGRVGRDRGRDSGISAALSAECLRMRKRHSRVLTASTGPSLFTSPIHRTVWCEGIHGFYCTAWISKMNLTGARSSSPPPRAVDLG